MSMRGVNKAIVSFLAGLIIFFSIYVIVNVNQGIKASANTIDNYFTAEQYTDSDFLLFNDGTTSTETTIGIFAAEVRSASVGTAFPELSQVIPRQYLESSETNAVFQYNGKEYGFYVAKEGERFEVLLIDFVYEFEDDRPHSDLEYKIRIKPILQQTFLRLEDDNGNYTWTKSGESNYKTNGAA